MPDILITEAIAGKGLERLQAGFSASLEAELWRQPEVLKERLAGAGIRVLSLPSVFAAAGGNEALYLATDTHWRPVGHTALVAPLSAFLAGNGLLGE